MSPITTHVLDTALGRPAAGVPVRLERAAGKVGGAAATEWQEIGRGNTDGDGRIASLLAPGALTAGTYRITFDTAAYFSAAGRDAFYPYVQVVFAIRAPDQHYHVPLLLSPFGYSTYRGS